MARTSRSPSPIRRWKKWWRRRGSRLRARAAAVEFVSDPLEIENRPTPFAARALLVSMILFLVGCVVWSSIARLDRIVAAEGRLVTTAPRIFIQPLDVAVVHSINVRVGQSVEAGQILATLDPTVAEADVKASQDALVGTAAIVARLRAELSGTAPASFSPDPDQDRIQRQIYEAGKQFRRAEQAQMDAEIREVAAQIEATKKTRAAIARELVILDEIAAMREKTMTSGSGSRLQWLDAKRQQEASLREAEAAEQSVGQLDQKLDSAVAARDAKVTEWQAATGKELWEAEHKMSALVEEVRKNLRLRSLVTLSAPVRGVVVDVAPRSVGSVARQAEPLVTLVAADGDLEAEVQLDPKDIGHLRVGDKAKVKLEALPFQRYGTLTGKLISVSGDVIEEEVAGHRRASYKGRLTISSGELRGLPADFRLIPGMAVTAEIKIGSRSVISYFLYPIFRTLDSALREP